MVNECAVRLNDIEKLNYHRKCHKEDRGFNCQECGKEFEKWQGLALHLWRAHKMDMELYSCNLCDSFRSFTAARLHTHQLSHKNERPFLCDFCGKGFKTVKNMKNHELQHLAKLDDSAKKEDKGSCRICKRSFTELRLLKFHIDTVHKKIKPHLCNFCGYSGIIKYVY